MSKPVTKDQSPDKAYADEVEGDSISSSKKFIPPPQATINFNGKVDKTVRPFGASGKVQPHSSQESELSIIGSTRPNAAKVAPASMPVSQEQSEGSDSELLVEEELALDENIRESVMKKEDRLTYYKTKMIRSVDMQVDAPAKDHLKLVGVRHNHSHTHLCHDDAQDVQESSDSDVDDKGDLAKASVGREKRSAHFNQVMYLKNYCIKFEIPTAHVLNSRVFTKNDKYIFQVVKFIVPSEIRTLSIIQPPNEFYKELNDKQSNIMIRFKERSGAASLTRPENAATLIKHAQKATTAFSEDGTMFACLIEEYDNEFQTSSPTVHVKNADNLANSILARPSVSDPLCFTHKQADNELSEDTIKRSLYVFKIDSKEPRDMINCVNQAFWDQDSTGTKGFYAKIRESDLTDQQGKPIKLDFCDKLLFDLNNRYLVGYGKTKFFHLDLNKPVLENVKDFIQVEKINKYLYDSIQSITVCSNSCLDKDIHEHNSPSGASYDKGKIRPKIYLVCKRRSRNQLHVFEWFQDVEFTNAKRDEYLRQKKSIVEVAMMASMNAQIVEENMLKYIEYLEEKKNHIVVLNYKDGSDLDQMKVCISHDFKQIFFANQADRFVVFKDKPKDKSIGPEDTEFAQKRVKHIKKDFNIVFIEEDYQMGGFYLLACRAYDQKYRLMHTAKTQFKISFKRVVEADQLKFYDIYIKAKPPFNKCKLEATLLGVDHEQFTVDHASVDQEEQPGSGDVNNRLKLIKPFKVTQQDFCDFGAYSLQWPMMAFADSDNNVYILNCQDKDVIHRVQMPPKEGQHKDDMKICKTYISKKRGLFVLIHSREKFYVYKINVEFDLNTFKAEHFENRFRIQGNSRDDGDSVQSAANNVLNSSTLDDPILILTYTVKDNIDPSQFYVRDVSTNDRSQTYREQVFVFTLHGQELYSKMITANETKANSVDVVGEAKNQQFHLCKDDSFYFLDKYEGENDKKAIEEGKNPNGQIKICRVFFMTTDVKIVHQEDPHGDEEIRAFSHDFEAQKLILLVKVGKQIKESEKKRYFMLKIFDLKTRQVEAMIRIRSPVWVGMLISGNYMLIDGHIYHRNMVIKIRYDIIQSEAHIGKVWEEDVVFDTYDDLLRLRPGCRISSDALMNSFNAHRLAFISQDIINQNLPCLIRITPYLHERRIYFDTTKPFHNYFMTSINLRLDKRDQFNKNLHKSIMHEDLLDRATRDEDDTKFQVKKRKQKIKAQTLLLRMNISEHKLYVYSQNGLLLKRVNFQETANKYGRAIACSNNGKIHVFRRENAYLELMTSEENLDQKYKDDANLLAIERALTFTLVEITATGLRVQKNINVLKGIEQVCKAQGKDYDEFKKDNQWLYNKTLSDFFKNVDARIEANNAGDVVLKLTNKDVEDHDHFHDDSIFYIEEGGYNDQCNELPQFRRNSVKQSLEQKFTLNKHKRGDKREPVRTIFDFHKAHDHDHHHELPEGHDKWQDFSGAVINKRYLLFWTKDSVFAIKLSELNDPNFQFPEEPFFKIQRPEADLTKEKVKKPVKNSCAVEDDTPDCPYIYRVRPGNDKEGAIIAITIREDENEGKNTILTWNLAKNHEINQHKVKAPFFTAFDQNGNIYVVDESMVRMSNQYCDITAYDYDEADVEKIYQGDQQNLENQIDTDVFGLSKGSRFDGKNHNWLMFENYLALSFSYMTFVIKDKLEKNDPKTLANRFDMEPYNYIFNKRTSFIDSQFIRQDTDELGRVLEKLEEHGVEHLGILNYINAQENLEHVFQQEEELFSVGTGLNMSLMKRGLTDWPDRVKQQIMAKLITKEQLECSADSALHLAYSHQAPLNIELLLQYMAKIEQNAAINFKDILHRLVVYKSFRTYFASMLFQTDQMKEQKMISILQDKEVNYCRTSCICCKSLKPLSDNMQDENMFQSQTSNTSVSQPGVIKGLSLDEDGVVIESQKHFSYRHILLKAMRVDWMMKQMSKDDKQPVGIKLLKEINASDDIEYFKIPAVQAHIAYLHNYLYNYSVRPLNLVFTILDVVQVLLQILVINNIMNTAELELKSNTDTTKFSNKGWDVNKQTFQLVLSFLQCFLILNRLLIAVRMIYYKATIDDGKTCWAVTKTAWFVSYELIITLSRISIVLDSIVLYQYMLDQKDVSFEEMQRQSLNIRLYLILNLVATLLLCLTILNIFWEKAGEFNDLFKIILEKMVPFMTFVAMFMVTFILIFYMIGQHQVGFEFHSTENFEDWQSGVVNEYKMTADRKEEILGNAQEENINEVPYDNIFQAFLFVYQIFLGDATPEFFAAYKAKDRGSVTMFILWLFYIPITFILLIVLLNMIIAIMGDAQSSRSAHGRAIVYKAKLQNVLNNFHRFSYELHVDDDPDHKSFYGERPYPSYLIVAQKDAGDEE